MKTQSKKANYRTTICLLWATLSGALCDDMSFYITDHGFGTPELLDACFTTSVFAVGGASVNDTQAVELPLIYSLLPGEVDCLARHYRAGQGWFIMGGLNVTNVASTGSRTTITAHSYSGGDVADRRLATTCEWHLGATCSGTLGEVSSDSRVCSVSGCSGWSENSGRSIVVTKYSSGFLVATCARSWTSLCRTLGTSVSGALRDYTGVAKCTPGRFDLEWKLTCN